MSAGPWKKPKTHCKRGHPFSEENTYHRPDQDRDCMTCRRLPTKRWRLERTGWTLEDFYQAERDQNNLCAICGRSEWEKRKKSLSADHCHKCVGKRKLLCNSCNTAIGQFEDNVDLLKSAIKYLEDHQCKPKT